MKSYSANDLMVPLSEYATVSEDATLYDAVLSLEKAQEKFEDKHTRYRHRAILVLDKDQKVIGKLSQLDVLKSPGAKVRENDEGKGLHRFGFTKQFMKSMMEELSSLCQPFGGYLPQSRGAECQKIYACAHRGRIHIHRRSSG